MKKIIAAAAFATMLLPSVSFAETMRFPSDAPVAEITIPDSWSPEETETGIQATSEDEAIYLSIDIADETTTDKVIEDAIAFLDDNGVKMSNFDWSGTDKDGPASIGLSLVSPKRGKLLVITYWGTKGEQEKHAEELLALISSLKPASK